MRYYRLATASFVLIALLVEAVCFMPLPLTYQYVSSIHKLTQISSILTHPPIIMCTIYVPPSPNESSQLSLINYLHNLFSSSHTVIVLGDFNCPDINWDLYTSTSEFSFHLCEIVVFQEYKFCEYIHCFHPLAIITVWPHPKHVFSHLDSRIEETFEMDSCIRGYHVYKEVWMFNGEDIIFINYLPHGHP